jgi:hypothetical protein
VSRSASGHRAAGQRLDVRLGRRAEQCDGAYVAVRQDGRESERGTERQTVQPGGVRDRRAKTHALLDVFVMNFKTHVVFDYAPGSLHPESSGTIKIVKTGKTKAP